MVLDVANVSHRVANLEIHLVGTTKHIIENLLESSFYLGLVAAAAGQRCWEGLQLGGQLESRALTTISVWLFLGCRMILAVGEAGNFPAAIKATAEYFPKKDRAFSTSIFNSGASVGALAAPATIPLLARAWGWEMAFIIIGALGFIWMGLWAWLYDKPAKNARVNQAELNYIEQDNDLANVQDRRRERKRRPSRSGSASPSSRPGRSSWVSS